MTGDGGLGLLLGELLTVSTKRTIQADRGQERGAAGGRRM
jgi:hypothetical protein